jgi:hypothetical protein
MSRQHATPYIVTEKVTRPLKPDEDAFKEDWLQEFIFTHYQALPINEIEPGFAPLIPVCRELGTKDGSADILFLNKQGLITLVECKLWQNPQARREVIAQILDYAKDISRWSYEELQEAVGHALKQNPLSLYNLMSEKGVELDESEFIDNVSRNMKRGRFLLLIIGNGIRDSVELIADFLQKHAHLNFSFALVELGIFHLPEEVGSGHLIQSRIIAQTFEIERAVIRIEDGKIVANIPAEQGTSTRPLGRRTKISEQAFFDAVAKVDANTSNGLQDFFTRIREMGLEIQPGQNSMMIKLITDENEFNLGTFNSDGSFQNFAIAQITNDIGYPDIGEKYLARLASLFEGGYVNKNTERWRWAVKKGRNQNPTIAECLAVQDKWLDIIREIVAEIDKAQRHQS